MTRRVDKPWGEEIMFAHTSSYAGKLLRIRKGESLRLQDRYGRIPPKPAPDGA